MNLENFKAHLQHLSHLNFRLPDGQLVPTHFHVTEVAALEKRFIDCGGVLRHDNVISLQLWVADDAEHRLTPNKLLQIIELAQKQLALGNETVVFEYQLGTISQFDIAFENGIFALQNKATACLAVDQCGVTPSVAATTPAAIAATTATPTLHPLTLQTPKQILAAPKVVAAKEKHKRLN